MSCGRLCEAQQFKQVPPAPIPSLILTAKKVFIANGGGNESLFDMPQYTGGPDRLYNEFYAAVKSWGRYELVGGPGDADLVFEIRLTTVQPMESKPLENQNPRYDSQFHLAIRDVKTHETLWGLTEHAQTAILQGNRDKKFRAGPISNPLRIAKNRRSPASHCEEQCPSAQLAALRETGVLVLTSPLSFYQDRGTDRNLRIADHTQVSGHTVN